MYLSILSLLFAFPITSIPLRQDSVQKNYLSAHNVNKLFLSNKISFQDRVSSYEKCCPDEGEDCPADEIKCHATEMFLRKSYATCCEADGEDCPHDHVSSCDHVEHVLSRVFLDPNRVNTFEKCCPDEGEDCPDEDYDCHESEKFLHKGHEQCCEAEGEDCPPGVEDSCQRISKMFFENRLHSYEKCCPEEGEDCPEEEIIDCHATEMFLRKSHAACCEADGEDCPHDHVSSCEHVEHVLSQVLFENRLHSYEKCCPDEGEDCPEEAIQCHDTEMFLRKSYTTCCEADGEDCPHDHVSSCEHLEHVLSRVLFENRLHSYEKCCPDEGEDCPADEIKCHATEMFLRKSYATCCEADGEDCPHDHVSSCDHVEHVLSRVFLDPNRVNTFEKCCPDEGEDCPDEDYDCHESEKFLHKGHEQCCEAEGEDCPPGVEDSCQRVSYLLQNVKL